MEMENKISREVAEQDFNNWCDALDIDYDMDCMTEDEKKDFTPVKDKIVKAIMKGSCVVDGNSLEYTLSEKNESGLAGKKITIAAPNGKTFLGLDGFKETQGIHRLNSAMSAITGLDIGVFAKLWAKDWSFMSSVVTLFLSI